MAGLVDLVLFSQQCRVQHFHELSVMIQCVRSWKTPMPLGGPGVVGRTWWSQDGEWWQAADGQWRFSEARAPWKAESGNEWRAGAASSSSSSWRPLPKRQQDPGAGNSGGSGKYVKGGWEDANGKFHPCLELAWQAVFGYIGHVILCYVVCYVACYVVCYVIPNAVSYAVCCAVCYVLSYYVTLFYVLLCNMLCYMLFCISGSEPHSIQYQQFPSLKPGALTF